MSKKEITQIKEITNELVINMIHEIRGQKVMLDFELAELYGYETKALNQQVKNNIERFPEDFMFQLTSKEVNSILRSKILTTSNTRTRRRKTYLPYAFTEQGIYMLSTILKGEVAIQQSIALMRILKSLRNYYQSTTALSINDVNQIVTNTESIKEIKATLDEHTKQIAVVMDCFKDSNLQNELLILDNQRIEADIAYKKDIFICKGIDCYS